MDKLFNEWKKSTPKFDKNLQHLFNNLTRKGGGAESDREDKGRIFSNNYELYMYAFFLGLYNEEYIELPETSDLKDFSHAIQYWGSTKSALRKDFTNLQEYMFMAVVAKTEGIEDDLIELDKGKKTVEAIKKTTAYNNAKLYQWWTIATREKDRGRKSKYNYKHKYA